MSSKDEIVTFVKGKTIKPLNSNSSSRLTFLVKSNMKVLPAYKMILKRIKFVKNSNFSIKKNFVIKGMGKNLTLTLKIATMLMEELEDQLEDNIKIYTKQVLVYNKLVTLTENNDENDFSDAEDGQNNISTTEIRPKMIPGVEIHIPLGSSHI